MNIIYKARNPASSLPPCRVPFCCPQQKTFSRMAKLRSLGFILHSLCYVLHVVSLRMSRTRYGYVQTRFSPFITQKGIEQVHVRSPEALRGRLRGAIPRQVAGIVREMGYGCR